MEEEAKMIAKQETLGKIRDYFNLNIYETKVWLALLSKGVTSAGQIAEISGVPRSRTYDVLESLEKKGFAIVKIGKPVKFVGVKPQLVIEKMKNNVRKEAHEKMLTLKNLKSTEEFTKLEEIYKEGKNPISNEEFSAALKGKSNISNYLRDVIENSEKEVTICSSVEDIQSKLKIFRQTFGILKKRGIKVNIALSGDADAIKKVSALLGTKIKKVNLDAKFFLIDRKEIVFYLSKDEDKNDNAIWINSEFFAQAFATLFDKAIKK